MIDKIEWKVGDIVCVKQPSGMIIPNMRITTIVDRDTIRVLEEDTDTFFSIYPHQIVRVQPSEKSTSNKPVGGRGKKAPYETATVRIPRELVPLVEQLTHDFRQNLMSGEYKSAYRYTTKEVDYAVSLARGILKQKKSSKQSLQKLLQLLYVTEDFVL